MRPPITVAAIGAQRGARQHVDHQVDTAPAGGRSHLLGPRGIGGVDGQVGAGRQQLGAPPGIARTADHQAGTEHARHAQAHQAHTRAGALDQHRLPGAQLTVGDQRIVHRLQCHRQGGRVVERHVGARQRQDAAAVGHRLFGQRAAARAHHAVAHAQVRDMTPKRDHFAGPLEAEHGARPADGAVHVAGEHAEVGMVERRDVHAHQHVAVAGLWWRDVGQFEATCTEDGRFHRNDGIGFTARGCATHPRRGRHRRPARVR
jgi:hypothetical protein